MNRRVFLCSLLIATGCARSDRIVEVWSPTDVTGRWTGTWSGSGAAGNFEMTLQQTGPTRVTGYVSLPGADDQPIEGFINRDVFNFWTRDGRLQGELLAAGDEMSGTGTWGTVGTKTLRLQRQP